MCVKCRLGRRRHTHLSELSNKLQKRNLIYPVIFVLPCLAVASLRRENFANQPRARSGRESRSTYYIEYGIHLQIIP